MKSLFRAAAIGALIVAGSAGGALAQSAPATATDTIFRATTLSLSAYGEVRQKPDKATISLGVQTEAPTAAEAMRLNASRMTQVIAALKKSGIADRDIRTSGLSLSPQYVYQENLPPRLTGYRASNQVTVTVLDLTRLGPAVDAVVESGATDVGGIAFGLQNSDASEDAARQDAIRTMLARANLYARATGYSGVRLVTMSEGGGGYAPPQPMVMANFQRMDKAESTPVEAGELTVRIDLNATFELIR